MLKPRKHGILTQKKKKKVFTLQAGIHFTLTILVFNNE